MKPQKLSISKQKILQALSEHNQQQPETMDVEQQLEQMLEEKKALKWMENEGRFTLNRPQEQLLDQLPAGAYEFGFSMMGPYVQAFNIKDEELIPFADGAAPTIIEEIEKFWTLEERYEKLGIPYRRGILMYGIPGTGKSGIVRLVCENIINQGGLVAYCEDAGTFSRWIPILNKMEKDRKMVIVFEDVDNLVNYDEHAFLQLLDGISNDRKGMLFLATTNFMDHIPERIYRPSRFDLLIEVGVPCKGIRREYVARLCEKFEVPMNEEIVEKTEGLSFAHVKEVLVSCLLFDRSVDEMVDRMRLHGAMTEDDE